MEEEDFEEKNGRLALLEGPAEWHAVLVGETVFYKGTESDTLLPEASALLVQDRFQTERQC